jgi:hypothetical protein
MADALTIVVDRRTYEVETSQGEARVRHGDLELELPAWTGARHLEALCRHLVTGSAGLELDGEGYAAEVLALTDAPVERWNELAPLALWWATRPDLDPSTSNTPADVDEGALHGGARAHLGECTWRQRLAAASAGLQRSDDGAAIDPVAVMEQLLAHVVEAVEEPDGRHVSLDELGASSFVRLSSLVLDHGCREAPFSAFAGVPDASEPARRLLELCRALGRTPTQVLEMPAAEVDLVRELMRRAAGVMPEQASTPSRAHAPLHDAADAVVIRFDGGSP